MGIKVSGTKFRLTLGKSLSSLGLDPFPPLCVSTLDWVPRNAGLVKEENVSLVVEGKGDVIILWVLFLATKDLLSLVRMLG